MTVPSSHPWRAIKQKLALVKVKMHNFASFSFWCLSSFNDLKILPKRQSQIDAEKPQKYIVTCKASTWN